MLNRLTFHLSRKNGLKLFKPISNMTKLNRNLSDLKHLKIPTLETRYKLFETCNSVPIEFKFLLQKLNLTLEEQIAFIALMKARGTYDRLFWKGISATDILRWEIKTHIHLNTIFDLNDVKINSLTKFTLENLERNQELVSYAVSRIFSSPEFKKIYNDTAPIIYFFLPFIVEKELCFYLNGIFMKILGEKMANNWNKNEDKSTNCNKL